MINTPSASLEDCHTNVLALTELSGLKWRRLTTPDGFQYGSDLDQDPILSSYSRCVRENILSTWRRRPRQEQSIQIENLPLRLDAPKELWIFWYSNDEPELIKVLEKENGLIAGDDTEFSDSTIKYETRTQFFKALHNVLERNMLRCGYLRFGRWFTRPLDDFAMSSDCALPSYAHGMRFEFSVQGENHVCATIKTQCQPPILRLTPKHLDLASNPLPVILAPWSIRAHLLPQQPLKDVQNTDLSASLNSSGFSLLNASMQQQNQQTHLPEEVQTIVDDKWAQWSEMVNMATCPSMKDVEQNENMAPSTNSRKPSEKLPRFVAVEVDGTRMFYPSCFVGVVSQELAEHTQKTDQRSLMSDDLDLSDSLVGFSQDSQIDLLEIRRQKVQAMKKKETFVPEVLRHSRKSHVGLRMARRSFEDAGLAAPPIPLPAISAPRFNEVPSTSSVSEPLGSQRVKTDTGLHLNMPSTSASSFTTTNASDDLRWNYFDYLRKEYCYCSMCSAGNGNRIEGSLDVKQPPDQLQTSTPYLFHRSTLNDHFGADPNLFSPPQNPQKVISPDKIQRELDFLRQLDEKERQHSEESKVPIFARTIPTIQRTAIPSDRLNFASVQECNFNNIFKRHLNAIGYRIEHQLSIDTGADFEPFTPITCVTPDPEANQEFNNPENQWTERIRNFNYPYHPQKTDFINKEPYHVKQQRDKQVGPRLRSGDNVQETPTPLIASSSQSTSSPSILKSLLDAVDEDDPACLQPMQHRVTSPESLKREEDEWKRCIGEVLRERIAVPTRRYMSRREAELRRWYSQQCGLDSKLQARRMFQTGLLKKERRMSVDSQLPSALRERPSPMESNLNSNAEEYMEIDQQRQQIRLRRMSLPNQIGMVNPIQESEEAEWSDKGPLESLFYGQHVKERYLLENAKDGRSSKFGSIQKDLNHNTTAPPDDYATLRRMIQEDLAEVENPKTPIASLNTSIGSHVGSSHQQDLQQMFTSPHANDVHNILSPPASNEQIDGNPLSSQQQHTPGDKSQPLQSQNLVSVGQGALMLHSGGWNTGAVTVNNIHDSLNIVYPTPPTPHQQFSPLNANPLLPEDSQAKKRRLVEIEEYSETEQAAEEDQADADELNDSRQSGKNKFLNVENLTGDLFKTSSIQVFNPKKVDLPPYSEAFNGDLLDEKIDPNRRLSWLRHLNKEPLEKRQQLKEDLKKRLTRKKITLPLEYVSQFKDRRVGLSAWAMSNDIRRLAKNAVDFNGRIRRKPINGYGCGAAVRLNIAYQHEKRHNELRQLSSRPDQNGYPQMARQFSAGGNMYGQRQFNHPVLQQQASFGSDPMTSQHQQMMMAASGHMIRPGHFSATQMYPNGLSPGYPSGNFNRMPRYPLCQTQMLGYFNNPSPVSSMSSNPPSQVDPHQISQGQQISQRPGSVAPPLQFGSPGIQMGGSLQQQRTPSMPPSVTANQNVFSVDEPSSVFHIQRSQADQTKTEEILSLFQSCQSRIIVVLMRDTLIDLHYDSVFDSCPICSCNANIRSTELGLYVQAPGSLAEVVRIQQKQQQDPNYKVDYWSGLMLGNASGLCSCGFSAVRHRFLCSDGRGLFPDDVQESSLFLNTALKAMTRGNERSWAKKKTLELMDCFRFLSLTRNLATCFKQAYYLGDFQSEEVFFKPNQISSSSHNANYIISKHYMEEFEFGLKSALQVAKGQPWTQSNETRPKKPTFFHPWGFQVASLVRDPKDQECLAVIKEVQYVLERSMKEVRGIDPTNQTNIVEGPLTWRLFHRKVAKSAQEDDSYKPEQIPQILVSADRDPIATSPQLIHLWDKLTLGPYDQAKDVLYLAVAPDSNVIVEKCKVFLEELSTVYEKCRFGRHVKLATKDTPRDGIIRINMKSHSVVNAAAQGLGANNKFNEEDRRLSLRITAFCDQVLTELKAAVVNNASIFERRAYYETLYRDSLQPNYTSLATSADSNYMPPPAVPMIQSPLSILSTASGPASQPLNPMSNPPATNASLFSAPNTNQLPSPALSTSDNLMEPLRTPEGGTPIDQEQRTQQTQQAPPSQHLTPEAIEKAVDEMMSEHHPLSLPHLIVIYLVNPFTFGSETCSSRIARSAGLLLMKTFNSLLAAMSPRRRPQIQIELINLQTLYDYSAFISDPLKEERQLADDMSRNDKPTAYDCLRRVAFSVYSQTRLLIPEHVRNAIPSSMTRFGPASAMSDILDDLNRRDIPFYFKIPTMPYILAPTEVLGVETANNKVRLLNTTERVLFVAYCLPSKDFLCVAVTDQFGHLLDNAVINLHVDQPPSHLRYKNKSQIFDAIYRLWLYIQSVLVLETRNWRLVINRVGKIGHGEFKAWSQVLSKNSLRSFNNSFKGRDRGDGFMSAGLDSASSASNCKTCQQTASTQEVPIILSACLLSMEAEPNLRIFSSSNNSVGAAVALGKSKNSTKNGGATQVQMIDDPSVTHIVAFPISPDIIDAQHGGNQQGGQEDENIFDDLNFGMDEMMQDVENIDALMGNTEFNDGTSGDTTIDHQPMAVGYVISTAPANDLPDWFWSSCPNLKRQLPVHLKSALHINSSNIHDELSIGQKTGNETFHPLDDSATDSLLRYIMKTHNSLSWLNIDVANGVRISCLPVHIQALFRLHRTIETIYS